MVYESFYYKDELQRISERMKKRLNQKKWQPRSFILFEKDIFFSFFIIRKLIEAKGKLSTENAKQKFKLIKYESTGKRATILNDHKIERLYRLESSHQVEKDIEFLCNQAIHSYVFCPVFGEEPRGMSLLLNSFKERNKALYSLSIIDLIGFLDRVSKDYPSDGRWEFNQDLGDYEVYTT